MAKHVPKSAGLAILAVITALVLWDASRTSDALDDLPRQEPRTSLTQHKDSRF